MEDRSYSRYSFPTYQESIKSASEEEKVIEEKRLKKRLGKTKNKGMKIKNQLNRYC